MSADVVNLNRVRKARLRAAAAQAAGVNRVAHGRTGAQKEVDAAEQERRARLLDGARRDPDPVDGG